MKLGKAPATFHPKDLMFSAYRTDEPLPVPAGAFGYSNLIKQWLMLGNDIAGDCVLAAADEETRIFNAMGGKHVEFNDKCALSDYSAITGYKSQDPSTDQGTDMHKALDYRVSTGVIDAQGNRHKLGAYLSLEPGNWNQLIEALWLLGPVTCGFQFPDTARHQFDAGQEFSVRPGYTIEGGHCFPIVAVNRRHRLEAPNWARLVQVTKHWYEKFNDESYALLSQEMLINGHGLRGLDLGQLQADMQRLTGVAR